MAVLKYAKQAFGKVLGTVATFPFRFRTDHVAPPPVMTHGVWPEKLSEQFNKPGLRVLEIGSRVVTGRNYRRLFDQAHYVGFDFLNGPNVDVVGDCHKLSSCFDKDERFDLIFSSAVFEHLYMPWIAAAEIAGMLNIGGHVFIETHFSFSSHERPWNFFQFSDMGLQVLFSPALGFELIEKGMSNPIGGFFTSKSVKYLRYQPVTELYCHSEIFCRKTAEKTDIKWDPDTMDAFVGGTRYPDNKAYPLAKE